MSPPLRTWDFKETALVGLIAYAVYGLTAWFVLGSYNAVGTTSAVQYQAYGAALILAGLLPTAVLWIAIRLANRDFGEYLALNWPSSDEALRAVLIMTAVMVIEVVAISVVGPTEISPNPYLRAGWGLLTFLIGSCIVVPVMEELVVRGFMFRGWSQSILGPTGAILLSSILWALAHTQYHWFGQFWIFVTGLALGYIRWRSNSTWLTVMLHSALNTIVSFAEGLQR
ncbi:CPBP family intramembrane glutamic endopeptidase [Bradyrhizobium sp. AUGA SZCCT0431]|uniref:CPBP family intramembrane glutamic endopeptidase n=1 Tax=Bradyrhizobium sp. AUGA SZCCT0431 TaxID=2807674 RepID=UPI001BA811F3|nr:type II CAAX endopeptidase family protein [Bradyrhizobium sp. AUGA SZCCT0431]MBR1146890.1 CPBP family intramembrane metalloprotease [Bradyrhizobium sp. AUGA SZCCT0431]